MNVTRKGIMSKYVRYGKQWRNAVMKNKKSVIVDMLRCVAMERDGLETSAQQKRTADASPESCEHGNLRGKCPVEVCTFSKHGGRG